MLLSVVFMACEKDACEDEIFPIQHLDNESRTFQFWLEPDALIFLDSTGQEHRYVLSVDFEFIRPFTTTIDCNGGLKNLTYHSDYFVRRFEHPNMTAIAYVHLVGYRSGEEDFARDRLIDELVVSIYDDNVFSIIPISQIRFMTSPRESNSNQEAYNLSFNNFHDSLTIFGKTFYDVFERNFGDPRMYYTIQDGVVSFTDNMGNTLVLDRVE